MRPAFALFSGLLLLLYTPRLYAQGSDNTQANHPTAAQNTKIRLHLGAGIPFTFNSARANATTNDLRIGPAIAAIVDFPLVAREFSVLATLSRTQLLWQREDGSKNSDICKEEFSLTLVSFPGYCVQYQAKVSPFLWFGPFAAGVSFAYNHFTDVSYKGSRIYNTKWAYGSLGLAGAYRYSHERLSLVAVGHFDYGVFSVTLTTQKIQALQVGLTIYAMYAIF